MKRYKDEGRMGKVDSIYDLYPHSFITMWDKQSVPQLIERLVLKANAAGLKGSVVEEVVAECKPRTGLSMESDCIEVTITMETKQ